MSDNNEMFVTQEERDSDRLEAILRHSSRRQDTPVMLVQLPSMNPQPAASELPRSPGQRRATIVNTVTTSQANLGEYIDPIEWYFRRNNPDLRKSLAREGAADELSSRRKSRIGGDQMEQLVVMLSNQSVNRFPVMFDVEERDNDIRPASKVRSTMRSEEEETRQSATAPLSAVRQSTIKVEDDSRHQSASSVPSVLRHHSTIKFDDDTRTEKEYFDGFVEGDKNAEAYGEGESDDEEEANAEEPLSVIDTIMKSMVTTDAKNEETSATPVEYSFSVKKSPLKETNMNSMANLNKEITVMHAKHSETNKKSPFKKRSLKETTMNSMVNLNKEITIMPAEIWPAEYSYTEQKSPFKDRDEIKPRPSSRVRVLIMLDEWDDNDSLEDELRRKRQADGDRGRGRDRDRHGDKRGGRKFSEESVLDETRKEYISDKSPLKDKDGKYKGGERSKDKRGRQPGDRDYDNNKYGDGTRPGESYDGGFDDDGKGKRGRKPGDRDYDKKKYGDGMRPGEGDDEGVDDDGKGKRGRKPGDRDYDKKKYREGMRPGEGDDEGVDDDGKGKWGRKPGDRDYDKKKYGEGMRPGEDYDEGFDDDGKRKRGSKPGDRDYDKKKYEDGARSEGPGKGFDDDDRGRKDRRGEDRKGKGRPEGDSDVTKYRMVTMPKSATTMTSRRRYHLQVTDHDMKEPWFNSCFNISKENNVDFNYEGPVKITPYYIGDKFS